MDREQQLVYRKENGTYASFSVTNPVSKYKFVLGMVVHTCSISTLQAETSGSLGV